MMRVKIRKARVVMVAGRKSWEMKMREAEVKEARLMVWRGESAAEWKMRRSTEIPRSAKNVWESRPKIPTIVNRYK